MHPSVVETSISETVFLGESTDSLLFGALLVTTWVIRPLEASDDPRTRVVPCPPTEPGRSKVMGSVSGPMETS